MKRLFISASNEHDSFILVVEINEEYIKCLERRIEWAREVKSEDGDLFYLEFSDGGDAYETGGDLGDRLEDSEDWAINSYAISSEGFDVEAEAGVRVSFVSVKLDEQGYLHWTALPKHGANAYETRPVNIERLRK